MCFKYGELMGGDNVSLNWWPGNQGTADLKQCSEKYRCNSDVIDRWERPSHIEAYCKPSPMIKEA